MSKLSLVDWIAFIILLVGGLNWALVGLFDFNLVSFLFGDMSIISRIVYIIVGLCGLYLLFVMIKNANRT